MNTSQDIKMQMVDDNYGNGNVGTAPVEGNGNGINGNPIRCYNCRGEGHYASNCTVKSRKQDVAYLQQQLQISQEEEAGIQSTQEEFEFMTTADAHEETERVKYTDLQTELDRTKEKLENYFIKTEKEYVVLWNNWYTKCEECKYDKILYDKAYNDMQQKIERLQAQLGDLKVLPKVDKMNALSKPITSNSEPSTRESKVVQTVNVVAPRIFMTNPSKTSRVDNVVPNNPLKQAVNNTAKTRRPHLRSYSNTDRVPSKSKSSVLSNNIEKIEENHRNSQIPKNQKHMVMECYQRKQQFSNPQSWKVYSVICLTNNSNGENQVVSKSFTVTSVDASDKRQQQQDSTSSTSTLATTITVDGNFDL
ncbi:reverse transcriptase domain-containing protein [Tanacetum coccineum]